ncbi:MAG: hypothetical protein PWP37_352 [Thermotogota bacterium]|nr:hypothetical protein [Thermotogota bacterium]MDK2864160.1 hypothetical protein [Thermotogota bacterium]HCZ05657.1 hypothetical protein [Thermotogota bacterium]
MEDFETSRLWDTKNESSSREGSFAIIVAFVMAMVIVVVLAAKLLQMVELQLESGRIVLADVVERYELEATELHEHGR